MSFLIADAMAATPSVSGPADGTFSLVMVVAIFVLFYFMLIRPQNKRAKEHRELISKLKIGDEIVMAGGVLGKVNSLDEHYLKVIIADGVEITLQRTAVNMVLPKGTIKSL